MGEMDMPINKGMFLTLFFCFWAISAQAHYFFKPPEKWKCADPKHLSPSVEMCFLGKGKTSFCPSINIATEDIELSLSDYMKAVKKIHSSERITEFRELGKIRTIAGPANLLELSTKTKFGEIKLLQAILVKSNKAFILTGAMHKSEFLNMSKIILKAFQSFTITDDLLGAIKDEKKKNALVQAIVELKEPSSKKEKNWKKLQKLILKDYQDMGSYWQVLMLKDAHSQFFSTSS